MFRLTRPHSNLSYTEAYRSLGFDTDHLGERRAVQAGYRADRYALEQFFYSNETVTNIEGKPFFDLKAIGNKPADTVMAEIGIPKAIWDEFKAEMKARKISSALC